LSFFDEDDEPRTTPRPRRAAPAGGVAADRQTLLLRRGLALAAALALLLLIVVGVRSCVSGQQESALRDYNREVASIGRESERGVGQEFFRLLGQRGNESPQDLQTSISQFRVQAQQQLRQAEELSVPDEMVPAHRSLLMSLQFRRDGLDYIAQRIRTALGDQGAASQAAVRQIAGQMQAFLTSDVLYEARVVPFIRNALAEREIAGQQVPVSRFLGDIAWLNPATVGERLGQSGGGATGGSRTPAPGRHGTGLDSVSIGNTRLQPGGVANRIPLTGDLAFLVRFTNQGENDESDVRVNVTIQPENGRPIRLSNTVDFVRQGATAEASLPLTTRPPTDGPVTVRVEVARVPGEQLVTNNRGEYLVAFVAP
jgi:hypothetical protein